MNDIVPTKTFEQKMKDRIKDSIGDLLSDEDLKKLMDRGIEECFFTPRRNHNHNGWSADTKENPKEFPSLMQQMLLDEVKPLLLDELREWIKENPKIVEDAVAHVIQIGAGAAMLSAMDMAFSGPMNQVSNLFTQFIHNSTRR